MENSKQSVIKSELEQLEGYNPLDSVEDTLADNKFEYWHVDDKGNISCVGDNCVYIKADDLISENFLHHYLTKADFHKGGVPALKEFYSAYMYALRVSGVKSITIDVNTHYIINSIKKI